MSNTEMQDGRIEWIRLSRIKGVGPKTFWDLISAFSNPAKAIDYIFRVHQRHKKQEPELPRVQEIEDELEMCLKMGVNVILGCDESYPLLLREIPDRSPILMAKGNMELLNNPKTIAVVGSRNAAANAIEFTKEIVKELGKAGYVVISGLAKGIDAAAHHAALETGTIGVVAGGVDIIYPLQNTQLHHLMYEKGLVISEAPLSSPPLSKHFPKRNRIIAGISQGVALMQATEKSGTIITAKIAMSYGRRVFAVPGPPFDPMYSGSNQMIRRGATFITSAEDIIKVLEEGGRQPCLIKENTGPKMLLYGNEANDKLIQQYLGQVWEGICYTPISLEKLSENVGLPMLLVNWIVIELEILGKAQRLYGNRVARLYEGGA